jgi:hypothetical protein
MQNHARNWFNNTSANVMAAIAIGAMLVFSAAGMKGAFADIIQNTIAADVTKNTITAGGSTTATYWIKVGDPDDPVNTCNARDGSPLTIAIGFPSAVTATYNGGDKTSPFDIEFTKCGEENGKQVTFSSSTAGTYSIQTGNIRDSGLGTYTDQSDFTLTVTAASGGGGGEEEPPTPGDTTPPKVTRIDISDTFITEADKGDSFDVTVTYNEPMSSADPLIAFAPDVSSTLSAGSGSWSSDKTVFTATYSVADADVEEKGIDISVKGGKDVAGNTQESATGENLFDIDTLAPQAVSFSGITDGQRFDFGESLPSVSCSASPDSDTFGPITCSVTPASLPTSVNTHTLTATAKDSAGNEATATLQYTIVEWRFDGFKTPVDNPDTVNTVKSGQTAPIKFEVFTTIGGTEKTSVDDIASYKQQKVSCGTFSGDPQDPVTDATNTGSTGLRYDTTDGQFIANWKTPAKSANQCWQITLTTDDGRAHQANFLLK